MTDPTGDDELLSAARVAAATALGFVAEEDAQGAFDSIMDYLSRSERGRTSAELFLTVLYEAAATMACTLGVFVGSLEPVKIGALDDNRHPVSIDEAPPVERTFVRALLAEIHGDREGTLSQIRLAFATSDPQQISSLLMRTLGGTDALVQACCQHDLPIPEWLAKHG